MEINANSIYLKDFFTEEKKEHSLKIKESFCSKVRIPDFQRNYSWDIKHVKDLIFSINENDYGYYIGNILIQNSLGTNSRDLIIDGQQRLTTIFLILKALSSLGLKNGLKNKNVLLNNIFFIASSKDLLRIEFIRENLNNSFRKIILSDDLSKDDFVDENSKKFYNNFLAIKKYIKDNIENRDIFFDKVTKIIFVAIKFNDEFDVNNLFEGLNSKGKSLSPVQLTKNALIGSAKKGSLNTDEVVKKWESIERSFEKNKTIWFDKFLRHFGFYNYGYVSSNVLFKKIKNTINNDNINILEFSNNFHNDSALYIKIRSATLLKEDVSNTMSECDWLIFNNLIKSISYMELDQVYGPIFSIIKYARNNEDYINGKDSKFLRAIKKIWTFAILVKYLDTKPSLYERDFANFSHNLNLSKPNEANVLFAKFKEIIKHSNKEKFILNINKRIKIDGENNKKITSNSNRNLVSQILLFYLTDGDEYVGDFTLEHIIPKGKKNGLEKWPNISKFYINQVKNIYRYKFGNLTLLRKDYLQNISFDEKLDYYKLDKFEKNKNIEHFKDKFNSDNPCTAVVDRGDVISADLYDLLIKNI